MVHNQRSAIGASIVYESELELANLDVIEFECPRCLSTNRVAIEKAGQRMNCSSCQGSLLVPAKSTNLDLFDDIFDSQSTPVDPTSPEEPGGTGSQPEQSRPRQKPPTEEKESSLERESDEDLARGISIPDPPLDDINPLEGDDPFKIDPEAPLKVDGIGDIFGHADVYGIKCNICDTRIHVRPDQANAYVECPECYSKVLVKPPEKNPKSSQRWVKENRDKKQKPGPVDDELKLSDPIDRPKVEIDESFGLESPMEDLLAPKPKLIPTEGEVHELEANVADVKESAGSGKGQPRAPRRTPSQPEAPSSSNASTRGSTRTSGKSRRELYEESQRRQHAEEAGIAYSPDESTDEQDTNDFPDFEFGSLFSAAIEMVRSPGVAGRVLIAVALMCFGAIVMKWFDPAVTPIPVQGDTSPMLEGLARSAAKWIVGGLPYLLGILMLWFTSAYVYRDAALGHRQVQSWKNVGRSEVTGTFLIFSFGYFVGGLFLPPFWFLLYLILPLRMVIAPLFLLSSWFSQSPFSIVNVDAFKNVQKEKAQWIEFYKFMAVLAFLGLVAALVFALRDLTLGSAFVLTIFLSVTGVLMIAAVTLVFAAVCGWHCGRVVEGLQEPN